MITKNVFISRKPYHAPTVKIAEMDGERLMAGSPNITGTSTDQGWGEGPENPTSNAKSLSFFDDTD